MRLPSLLLVLLCFTPCASPVLRAATGDGKGRLEGSVMDGQSHDRLGGAAVWLLGSGHGTTADASGWFSFDDVPSGQQRIVIQSLGYAADTVMVTVRPGGSTRIDVYLDQRAVELRAVEIQTGSPEGLTLIQALDLQLRPVTSSQELLRTVPGLFIAQHAGGGKAEQIFLRGFDIDHGTDLALSLDGMPVNMVSHAHGQGYADAHFIIPETVERLGIDKGPYAGRQGNLATAGSVDFQTKNSLDHNLVKVEGGNYHQYRALAMLRLDGDARRNTAGSAWVAGEYLYNRGYFESPQDLHRVNVYGKYRKLLGRHHLLRVSAGDFRSKWNASGQIPDRAVAQGLITRWGSIDPTEGGNTSRSHVNLQLLSTLANGWTLSQQAYANRYTFDLFSNFTFWANDSVNGDGIEQVERRWLYGYNGSLTHGTQLLGRDLDVEAGWSLRMDDVADIGLNRTRYRELLGRVQQGSIAERNLGGWVGGRWALGTRLEAEAYLRGDVLGFAYTDRMQPEADRKALAKAIASPKAALNYYLRRDVQLFVKAGTGFHSNDARVVLGPDQRQVLPRALGADVGAVFKPHADLLVQAAIWGLDMEQEFVYVGDEGIVEPGGRSRRVGLDLSTRWQVLPWLFADADLNLAHARGYDDQGTASHIPLAPWLTSTGGLNAQMGKRLSGSLRYRLLGDRAADEEWTLNADGYLLLDAALNYALGERYTIVVSGQNLLNSKWKEAQFATTSRLPGEPVPITEIHYTPGSPLLLKCSLSARF